MPSLFKVDKKSKGRAEARRQVPVKITAATASGTVLSLEFDQPLAPDRGLVPQYSTDVAGAEPVSLQITSPTSVDITYSAAIDAATVVNIPFEDPAIRNSVGGFVADSTFPVAA